MKWLDSECCCEDKVRVCWGGGRIMLQPLLGEKRGAEVSGIQLNGHRFKVIAVLICC